MATRKKPAETPPKLVQVVDVVTHEVKYIDVTIPPTAPGETGNAPLTKPTQRNESKWQQ